MNLNIQISDELYHQMKRDNKRIRGSIGLLSDSSVDFNRHSNVETKPLAMLKLPHGSASIRKNAARLTLYADPVKEKKLPSKIMEEESKQAVQFFFDYDLSELKKVSAKVKERSKSAASKTAGRTPQKA